MYNVTLTAMNVSGCNSIATGSVTVYDMPKAGFTATEVCQGNATDFTNTSTIASGSFSPPGIRKQSLAPWKAHQKISHTETSK